ncbi:MAG: DsbA family protein [Vicinamibacterales bacterium]
MRSFRFACVWIVVAGLLLGACGNAKAQGITAQQAEEMLKELRAIRQALERVTPPAPAPAQEQTAKLTNLGGYSLGRADAPLTLVEFTDLQCQFCNRFSTQVFAQIKAAYIDTGKVRFVTRDFPLDFHPEALPAARAARCAGEQDKFWEMRDALVRGYNRLGPAFVTSAAEGLKLDMAAFKACASSTKFDAAIMQDMSEGRAINVEGTPTFVLGRTAPQGLDGVLIVGAQPFAAFDAKIKELLAQAR